MTTESAKWKKTIEQGIRLNKADEQHQWAWGDLLAVAIVEYCSVRGIPVRKNTTRAITAWMREAGIDKSMQMLRLYYYTAKAWPKDKRNPTASYQAHKEIRGRANRFEVIKTHLDATSARKAMGMNLPGDKTMLDPRDTKLYLRAASSYIRTAKRSLKVATSRKQINISDSRDILETIIWEASLMIDELEEVPDFRSSPEASERLTKMWGDKRKSRELELTL